MVGTLPMKSYRVYKKLYRATYAADVYIKGPILIKTNDINVSLNEYIKHSDVSRFVRKNINNIELLNNKHTRRAFISTYVRIRNRALNHEKFIIDFELYNDRKLSQSVINRIPHGMEYVIDPVISPNIIKRVIDTYFPDDLETRELVSKIDSLNYLEVHDLIENNLLAGTGCSSSYIKTIIYNICRYPQNVTTKFRDYLYNTTMIDYPCTYKENKVNRNQITFKIYRMIEDTIKVDNVRITFPKIMKVNGMTLHELPKYVSKFSPYIEETVNNDLFTLVQAYLYINGISYHHLDNILSIESINECNYVDKIMSYLGL